MTSPKRDPRDVLREWDDWRRVNVHLNYAREDELAAALRNVLAKSAKDEQTIEALNRISEDQQRNLLGLLAERDRLRLELDAGKIPWAEIKANADRQRR